MLTMGSKKDPHFLHWQVDMQRTLQWVFAMQNPKLLFDLKKDGKCYNTL